MRAYGFNTKESLSSFVIHIHTPALGIGDPFFPDDNAGV
jgi:hypothetical protein